MRRSLWTLLLLLAFAAPAEAQQVRVRGKIEAVDLPVISVRTREGPLIKIRLSDGFTVATTIKASLDEINEKSYIGTAAMPQPDGTLRALEVHIFSEAQRGAGEGSRDFDLEPGSTMTNATVSGAVKGATATQLTLTYPGGQKIVILPPGVPIVRNVPGAASDVKPGVGVIVFAAEPQADGTVKAARITVGKDGVDPPM
jgi:hypothetical protein